MALRKVWGEKQEKCQGEEQIWTNDLDKEHTSNYPDVEYFIIFKDSQKSQNEHSCLEDIIFNTNVDGRLKDEK